MCPNCDASTPHPTGHMAMPCSHITPGASDLDSLVAQHVVSADDGEAKREEVLSLVAAMTQGEDRVELAARVVSQQV